MPRPTAHRGKAVLLTVEDMRRLSDALAETYPEARYRMETPHTQLRGKNPPRLLMGPCMYRIWQCACRWNESFLMLLDPAWTPVWHWDRTDGRWKHWRAHHPHVRFWGIRGPVRHYPHHPEQIQFGTIDVVFDRSSDEQRNWATRFLRLFGKFASNKDLEEVHWPSRVPVASAGTKPRDRLGAWRMVGHDARRWALEDPARVLAFNDFRRTALVPVPPTSP